MTQATFTMYTTPWCGYCHRLQSQLDREGIRYDVVNIEQVPSAAQPHRVSLMQILVRGQEIHEHRGPPSSGLRVQGMHVVCCHGATLSQAAPSLTL